MSEKLLSACTIAPLFASQRSSSDAAGTMVGRAGRSAAVAQTMLELPAGAELSQLQHPDRATILVQVLSGRVELGADETSWLGGPGDLLIVPQPEHTLRALEISTVLLTAVPRERKAAWIGGSDVQMPVPPARKSTQVQRWRVPRLLSFR